MPFDIPVLRSERGVIDVPVLVDGLPAVIDDGRVLLTIGLDYDDFFLQFEGWSEHGDAVAAHHSDVTSDPTSGTAMAIVAVTADAFTGNEEILVWAQFRFNPFAIEERYGDVSSLALRFDSQLTRRVPEGVDPLDVIDTGLAGQSIGQEVRLTHGSLTVYLQDRIEIGSARLSADLQTFTIPVFVTHMEEDFSLFTMGLDYDDFFLNLLDVRPAAGVGPQQDFSVIRWTAAMTGDDGRRMPGSIEGAFGVSFPQLLRHHLLDLEFELVPGEGLPRQLRVLPLGSAEIGLDGRGGAQQDTEMREGRLEIVGAPFIRGDVNTNTKIEVVDALEILRSVYQGGGQFPCREAADVNDNTRVDLSDSVYLLNFLFRAGPAPLAPFPARGFDPDVSTGSDGGSASSLGCERYGEPFFEPLSIYGR